MELYFKLDLISILGKTPLSNDGYFDLSNFSKLGFIKTIISFNLSNTSSFDISLLDIFAYSNLSIKSAIPPLTEKSTFLLSSISSNTSK